MNESVSLVENIVKKPTGLVKVITEAVQVVESGWSSKLVKVIAEAVRVVESGFRSKLVKVLSAAVSIVENIIKKLN